MNQNITVTLPLEEFEKMKRENVKNFVNKKYVPHGEDFKMGGNYELVVNVEAIENHFNVEFEALETEGVTRICRLNLHNADVAAES